MTSADALRWERAYVAGARDGWVLDLERRGQLLARGLYDGEDVPDGWITLLHWERALRKHETR